MKTKLIGAALIALLPMTIGERACADGMPIHADDPWAKAIGDTHPS
jgi:hypothetical protein